MSTLTEPQRDALRELANVGAGHAATTLSQLLAGERLAFQPPEDWTGPSGALFRRLAEAGSPWVAAVQDIRGDVSGALWLAFGEADAEQFAQRFLGEAKPGAAWVEAALVRAAKEAGASALRAMGNLTGLVLEGQAPVLRRGPDGVAEGPSTEASVLALEVLLRAHGFCARFLFVPESASLGALLRALRV